MSSINVLITLKTPIFPLGRILGFSTAVRQRLKGLTRWRMRKRMDVLLRIIRWMHRSWQRRIDPIFRSFQRNLTFWRKYRQVMTQVSISIWKSTWRAQMRYLLRSKKMKIRSWTMRRTLVKILKKKLQRQNRNRMKKKVAKVAKTLLRSQKVYRKTFLFSLFWKSKN